MKKMLSAKAIFSTKVEGKVKKNADSRLMEHEKTIKIRESQAWKMSN